MSLEHLEEAELERSLGELTSSVKAAKSEMQRAKDEMTEAANARDEKLADLEYELKEFGSEFGDSQEKLQEIAEEMKSKFSDIQSLFDTVERSERAIDDVMAKLDAPGGAGRKGGGVDILTKEAQEFYSVKHWGKYGDQERAPDFNPESITADQVKEYANAKNAFAKLFRVKSTVQEALTALNPEEQKAISTISHGNAFWLQTEMSNKLIECWEDETDLQSQFDSLTISKSQVQMQVDYDEDEDGVWNCEANCAPTNGVDPLQMGLKTYTTGELRAEHCVTHRMLEDSEIDIPAWLVKKVGRKFQKRRNNAFMRGDGVDKPDGILNDGNHVVMESGNVPSTPSGEYTWQDLVLMYIRMNSRFKANASWWFDEGALGTLMTMADGEGRPIFSPQVIQGGGMPRILGKPIREVTQMPDYLDGAGVPVVGSKPIALGDWKEGYVVINRKGFTILRDPWSMVRMGVVWHFTQRLGGGVMCPEAMQFMQIK